MARTPEGKVKDNVKAMLKAHGIWYFMPANNGMGKSGIPDFVCIVHGQFVGIECKATAKEEPTELQLRRKEEIEAAGGRWFLVRDDESLRLAEAAITT